MTQKSESSVYCVINKTCKDSLCIQQKLGKHNCQEIKCYMGLFRNLMEIR